MNETAIKAFAFHKRLEVVQERKNLSDPSIEKIQKDIVRMLTAYAKVPLSDFFSQRYLLPLHQTIPSEETNLDKIVQTLMDALLVPERVQEVCFVKEVPPLGVEQLLEITKQYFGPYLSSSIRSAGVHTFFVCEAKRAKSIKPSL